MRCLTLADSLRKQGAECSFICRPHSGHMLDEIKRRGHHATALPTLQPAVRLSSDAPSHADWLGTDWSNDARDTLSAIGTQTADWLVVDHYALDSRWHQELRPACDRLMVMDDLADRPHDCDLLLDPTLGRTEKSYAGLIPRKAMALLGPQYSLLRPEFAALRSESLARRDRPELCHLLVTMGGVDKNNATGSVLDALASCPLPPSICITAVLGREAPWLNEVKVRAAAMKVRTQVRVEVRNMARLMTNSDLAIGAGGGTAWERCCLGLPAFVLTLAENQIEMAKNLENAGAVIASESGEKMAERLSEYLETGGMEAFLLRSSSAASSITDGLGRERVCGALSS